MHEGVNAEASSRFHVVEPGGRGGAHALGSVCFPMRLWIVTPVTLAHGRSGGIEHPTETVVVLHGSLGGELRRTWRQARTVRGWYRLARLAGRTAPLLLRWRRAAPAVAAWAPVSRAVAAESRRELGIPSDRVTVVPACVDVVPPGDPEALARAIEELLSDGARRRGLGKQARVHAEQRFSQAVVAETVEKLLVDVAARQRGHGRPGHQ